MIINIWSENISKLNNGNNSLNKKKNKKRKKPQETRITNKSNTNERITATRQQHSLAKINIRICWVSPDLEKSTLLHSSEKIQHLFSGSMDLHPQSCYFSISFYLPLSWYYRQKQFYKLAPHGSSIKSSRKPSFMFLKQSVSICHHRTVHD